MPEFLLSPEIWIAFFTLTALELVLGIDNIIFISILVDKLPREQQAKDHIFRGVVHALARWPSAAPATTRHEAQPAAAGQAQRPAGWLAQHHDHIPRTVFVLLNELGVPQHCAAWPGGAQHHMDTLIADGSPPHSMGLWGVHEYVLAEAARPAASERERAGT